MKTKRGLAAYLLHRGQIFRFKMIETILIYLKYLAERKSGPALHRVLLNVSWTYISNVFSNNF